MLRSCFIAQIDAEVAFLTPAVEPVDVDVVFADAGFAPVQVVAMVGPAIGLVAIAMLAAGRLAVAAEADPVDVVVNVVSAVVAEEPVAELGLAASLGFGVIRAVLN